MKKTLVFLIAVVLTHLISQAIDYSTNTFYYNGIRFHIVDPNMMTCEACHGASFNGNVLNLPEYAYPNIFSPDKYKVLGIANESFKNDKDLQYVRMPFGAHYIGESAFYGCSKLETISLSQTLATIGSSAFEACISLQYVNLPVGLEKIEPFTFRGCESLRSVSIPQGPTEIGQFAFNGCSSLPGIVIPEGVKTIGTNAFGFCEKMKKVIMPKTLETIGESAFSFCQSMTDVTIPESVTKIEPKAFESMYSLSNVYCYAMTPPSCVQPSSIFINSNIQACTLYVPEGTVALYKATAPWSNFGKIEEIKIPSISLNVSELKLRKNESFPFEVTYKYVDASEQNIIWRSSNSNIVSVSDDGVVKAKADGTATITATCGDLKATCTIKVSGVGLSQFTFEKSEVGMLLGNKIKLNLIMSPANAEYETITYQNDEPNVVFVNPSTGEVSALNVGTAHITATSGYLVTKCTVTVYAQSELKFEYEGINYMLNENNLSTCKTRPGYFEDILWRYFPGNDVKGNVVLPGTVYFNGTEVSLTEIGECGFGDNQNMTAIVIPKTVTKIGDAAFGGNCGLKDIYCYATTPPAVGSGAFGNLPSRCVLHVPKGTKAAYQKANGWSEFGSIIEDLSQSTIEATSIKFVKENLKLRVGESEQLSVIVNPTNTTSTVKYSSSKTSVATVNDKGVVTACGGGKATITATCGFVTATCTVDVTDPMEGNHVGDIFYYNGIQYQITDTDAKTCSTGERCWTNLGDANTVDIELPEKVYNKTFEYTLTAIGKSSFVNCTSMKTISIPSTVTTIDNYAFSGCSKLQNIMGDVSVKKIGNYAFSKCSSLRSLECMANAPQIGSYAFESSAVETCMLDDEVTYIDNATFQNCTKLKTVVIGKAVTQIRTNAFFGCNALSEVYSYNTTPPMTYTMAFDTSKTDKTILYVPAGSKEAYAKATTWRYFGEIVELYSGEDDEEEQEIIVSLNKTELSLYVGDTEQLQATVTPTNAGTVTWTSSNSSVATVSATGLIKAISAGSATITAQCGGSSATCNVTVKAKQAGKYIDVTEDFTLNNPGFPIGTTEKPATPKTYKSSTTGITYSIMGCYINNYQTPSYILINGKNNTGAFLSFTLDKDCKQIKMTTTSGCSVNAQSAVNVYANNSKIGKYAVNVQNHEFVVEIPEAYQKAGTVYKIESATTAYNQQFTAFTYVCWDNGDASSMDVINDPSNDEFRVFNIQGMFLGTFSKDELISLRPGLYIINGKKVLIK